MFEIPADAPTIMIVLGVIVYIINSIYSFVGGVFRQDAKADEAAAAERRQWMAMQQNMLTTVLEAQHNKYATFTQDMQQHFDRVVEQVQENFTAALDRMVTTISAEMAPVSERRDKKLEAIQADVRAVPGEVWRLGDPKLDGLQGNIRADLEPLIQDLKATLDDGFQRIEDGVAARLEALGEEITPAMQGLINTELQQYQNRVQQQLEKIRLLVEALREDLVEAAQPESEGKDNRAGVSYETPERATSKPARHGVDASARELEAGEADKPPAGEPKNKQEKEQAS